MASTLGRAYTSLDTKPPKWSRDRLLLSSPDQPEDDGDQGVEEPLGEGHALGEACQAGGNIGRVGRVSN